MVRITQFRRAIVEEFGQVRGQTLATDHVLSALGGRTANEALDAGVPAKQIWVALCEEFGVPVERR